MGLTHAREAGEIEKVEALLSLASEREGSFACEGIAGADYEPLEGEGLCVSATGLTV